MLRNAERLLALLKLWKDMGSQYKHALTDKTLTRDTSIIAGIILTSAVLENNLWAIKDSRILDGYIVNHSASGERFDLHCLCFYSLFNSGCILVFKDCENNSGEVTSTVDAPDVDILEEYFNTYYQWKSLVPYNPWTAVYLFFMNKCVIYGWNYCDVLIILIARALFMKFKLLNTQVEERLRDSDGGRG